MGEGFL